MIQVLRPVLQAIPVTARWSMAGARSKLAPDLRVVASCLAGCVDRDELTPDEEVRLNDALDDAAGAVPHRSSACSTWR